METIWSVEPLEGSILTEGMEFEMAAFNSLGNLKYIDFKSICDLQDKVFDILAEFRDQEIIIEQAVTLKVSNILKGIFPTCFTVLMESARKEKEFPKLDLYAQGFLEGVLLW